MRVDLRRLPTLSTLAFLFLLAAFPLSSLAQEAPRGMCELAVEPAATLLLPYFEVDLDDPDGITTLLSVNNAWAEPALVNVTLWTDWGIPSINFQIFLTGYDVTTLNVRDLFVAGNLPITADEASDPDDTISPHGIFPEWDGSFERCDQFFPFYENPLITGFLQDLFRAYHMGGASPDDGLCHGNESFDGHVRGYITLDNVNQCTVNNPSSLFASAGEPAYFSDGGQGVANNNNQLWGDFYLVNPADNAAFGEPMVHIQAFDDVASGTWQDGDVTFYGRYIGDSAADNREPLPSTFGVRYLNGGPFTGGTELLVWREAEIAEPVECFGSGVPSTLPLDQREIFAFDEQEDAVELCYSSGCPVCTPGPILDPCLPLATQRSELDQGFPIFGLPFDAGWLYLDLNQRTPEEETRQAWVISRVTASGRFSVGLPAVALHSACDELPERRDLFGF